MPSSIIPVPTEGIKICPQELFVKTPKILGVAAGDLKDFIVAKLAKFANPAEFGPHTILSMKNCIGLLLGPESSM